MNLRSLTDDQLHNSTVLAGTSEREATIKLLKHLSEVERRHLFSKFACDSLHAYCVKYLKMSEPQAGRRVSAARLLNELPVIEEKVLEGSMTLTSVCQANTFFRKEAKAGNTFVREEKLDLLVKLESQSTRNVEQILLSQTEQPEIHLKESVKQRTESLAEIKLLFSEEALGNLSRLKDILSHEMPNATFAQVIEKLAKMGLEKLDPTLKAKRAADRKAKVTPAPESKRSRYIPAAVRHAVWMRDRGRCTFVNEATGECCESRRFVECDHITAFALSGDHSVENLRLRCRAHNQRHAIETFGPRYIPDKAAIVKARIFQPDRVP